MRKTTVLVFVDWDIRWEFCIRETREDRVGKVVFEEAILPGGVVLEVRGRWRIYSARIGRNTFVTESWIGERIVGFLGPRPSCQHLLMSPVVQARDGRWVL